MLRTFFAILLTMFGIVSAAVAANMKDIYRPTGQAYPQVIQNSDYATIEAIETFYVEISKVGKDSTACKAIVDSIILKSINNSKNENTVTLFTTLKKILSDLSAKHKCSSVRADQLSTRAYKKRTVLDFDFGDSIVELDSLSNGPNDEERLYTLDIVSRKDSFFYSN